MGTNGCISNCDTDRAVNLQSFEGESNIVGGENGVSVVYIDPIIFEEPNPEVAGTPPCVLVIPPSTIPTPTTISFEPIRTSIVVGKTIITVVTPSPSKSVPHISHARRHSNSRQSHRFCH